MITIYRADEWGKNIPAHFFLDFFVKNVVLYLKIYLASQECGQILFKLFYVIKL